MRGDTSYREKSQRDDRMRAGMNRVLKGGRCQGKRDMRSRIWRMRGIGRGRRLGLMEGGIEEWFMGYDS
jgi:hypothetical protein